MKRDIKKSKTDKKVRRQCVTLETILIKESGLKLADTYNYSLSLKPLNSY